MVDEQPPAVSSWRQGQRTKGELASIYARVSVARYNDLQRIRDERGWSLVTAIERAIDALVAKERAD